MKYLRLTICTICLVIMMMITSSYKVNAMTLNDEKYYPGKPYDNYSDYIVFYYNYDDNNYLKKGYYILSFNKTDNINVYTGYLNNGFDLGVYDVSKRTIDSSSLIYDYKLYFLNRLSENQENWNWEEIEYKNSSGAKRGAEISAWVTKILYSTVDMYYKPGVSKSTYSESTYLIPGEHFVNSSLSFDEKIYADKTYNKNNFLEKEIYMSSYNIYQDNVSKVQAIFNFSDYYDNNYKYYIKPQGKDSIDVTNEVLNGTSINGKGYVSLTFEKDIKVAALVIRNKTDLGISNIFNINVKNVSNIFKSNDNETYPDKPNDSYSDYIVFYYNYGNNNYLKKGYYILSFNKTDNINVYTGYSNNGFDLGVYDVSKRTIDSSSLIYDYKLYFLNELSENQENWNWEEIEYKNSSGAKRGAEISAWVTKILYSTVDMYYKPGVSKSTYGESTYLIPGEHLVNSSLDFEEKLYADKTYNKNKSLKEELIKFEDNIVNDLDNRSVNLLKVNFSDIYDDNYKYLISFDNKDWIDISDTIFSNKEHYIIYDLMANTTIYAKVLNQDNEELALSSKVINNLNDYQLIKSVSSTDTLNIYSIDYRIKNIQNTIGYEHYTTKIKLQYGSYDQTNKNRPYYLDYSITGLDDDGMELDIDLTDYYDVKIVNNEYYQGDYESFLYYDLIQKKSPLPNKVKQLKVSFYFTNLDNYYIHCYTTNTKSQTEIRFTESMFKDYVLYYFESGYDYALIRPKSFTTSSGSLISDAYYFNSGILEMTTYDFINNQISTIFDKTMNRKDYLIEGNNLKFDFTSDEDNKVYPALFLRKETYCNLEISYQNLLVSPGFTLFKCLDSEKRLPKALFYVHKDFYVQYINRETLETKVVNVDKEEFEEKNNLELTKDFQDKINDKYNGDDVIGEIKDSELFFKTLSKAFDSFKSKLSVILGDLNYFFNSLSTDYKYYFYVIFGLTLFGIVIRFIL